MSDADWERYKRRVIQSVVVGLDAAAPLFEQAAEANARRVIQGQTGATFAGIYAAVEGAGAKSEGVANQAVAAVEERNPAHVSVESVDAPPAGVVRLYGSVPTDYIDLLEASAKAFLYKTLDQEQGTIAGTVDSEVGKAV